ncbi:hypothetical protein VVT58_19365 (plasmid) [Sphingobium sp. SJ10-10]|uniref:hypothetical protein n=1 Tax=Sphingobium sp. SJ10-10 TaxID=3114999 RepID=UPI002E19E731|nr:hypothetical protein [Sphingobium sp. SJ10-10]
MRHPTHVTGDHTGIAFPVSYGVLEAGGTSGLTALFRQMGVIGPDNAVSEILHWKEFFGGGMGRKIAIDVAYGRDEGAPTRLFAKFTREFGDPLRELFSPVMDPEVRFALLSRRTGFPLKVPRCMFGDYNAEYKTGLLITERIPYGSEGIEPPLEKCVDYELADPLPYYEAQTRAIAALAAYHRAGHFGGEIEREFPFNPDDEALLKLIPFDLDELQAKLVKLRDFAARAPQLLPGGLADPAFLEDFAQGVMQVLAKERAIWRHLHGRRDAIALVHWNMNPDNGWFWRDEQGVMQSGQLDWGGVAQANLAQSYYGMVCAGEADFLARHDADLQALLLSEYARLGGPQLNAAEFDADLKLAIAVIGTAWMLDAPALLEAELPDYGNLTDRTDPRLRVLFLPRAQLQLLNVFLSEWRRKNIGEAVRQFSA